jgi:hypothetical protein
LPPRNRRAEARHLEQQIFRIMAEAWVRVNGLSDHCAMA